MTNRKVYKGCDCVGGCVFLGEVYTAVYAFFLMYILQYIGSF